MQGVLNVALSHDAEVAHHFDGRLSQHVVLLVGQSLAGSHDDGVTLDGKREHGELEAINCSDLIILLIVIFYYSVAKRFENMANFNMSLNFKALDSRYYSHKKKCSRV